MRSRGAFAFTLGLAALPVMGCGSGAQQNISQTISLSTADSGKTVVATVGDTIEVTLQTIGPGQYGTPTLSSASVTFVGEWPSPPSEQGPGGVRQLYRFEAVSSGRADVVIPHGGGFPQNPIPPFDFTVEVP